MQVLAILCAYQATPDSPRLAIGYFFHFFKEQVLQLIEAIKQQITDSRASSAILNYLVLDDLHH